MKQLIIRVSRERDTDKRTRYSFFRKLLSSWLSLLILSLVALTLFIIGSIANAILLQGLAGVLGGAALSLAVTIITGREAVHQQNAKEANIERKNTYYIPMFNELKQLFDRLEEAKKKTLPYPQWIGGTANTSHTYIWGNYPMPTFANWARFKEEPYRSNFTEKACKLFDEVQKSCEDYSKAASEAKDPVITILNHKIESAFQAWADTDDFKRWKAETNGGAAWSSAQYHQWNSYIYRFLERPSSAPPEAQSLVWSFNIIGWVLADAIDKASDLMQRTYQYDFQTQVTPDTAWFKNILGKGLYAGQTQLYPRYVRGRRTAIVG
jgi:hypothetical protein